jgi:hypothetical protein
MFGDEAVWCDESLDGVDVHPGRRDAERRQKRKADGVFTGRLLRALLEIRRCAGEGDPSEDKSGTTYESRSTVLPQDRMMLGRPAKGAESRVIWQSTHSDPK